MLSKAEVSRNKIIDVAEKLFLEKGYEKTTTQEIVNRTGMSKGAIFHHFSSKDDILSAVLEKHAELTLQDMKRWLSEMGEVLAKDKIIELYNRFYDVSVVTPLSKIALKSRSSHLIMEDLRIWTKKISPLIAKLLEEGNIDGSIQTEFPEECAHFFNVMFCIWCDPVILTCDAKQLRQRLLFIQHTMKLLGVDIASDLFIEKSMQFAEDLY